jgi:hypothetical protein
MSVLKQGQGDLKWVGWFSPLTETDLLFEAPPVRGKLVVGALIFHPFEEIVTEGWAGGNLKSEKIGNKMRGGWALRADEVGGRRG